MICLKLHLYFRDRVHSIQEWRKIFYEKYAVSREVFESASKASGLDVKALCFEENDRLNITEYTQIAMLTAEIAILRAVEEAGIRSQVNAGLSLGEYGALVALRCYEGRGCIYCSAKKEEFFMQEAYPTGGAMSAVLGTDAELIEKICDETQGIVSIANYNCPGQIVITGEETAGCSSRGGIKGSRRQTCDSS